MRKRSLSMFAVLLSLFFIQNAFSQSNDILDRLLDEDQATLGNAAYLVFLAAGVASEDWSVDRSIEELRSRDIGFEGAEVNTPVDFGSLSFLIMQTFDIKGGIMYSLFPGRRYAARELAYRGFIPGFASPSRILTGAEVTHVIGRTLDYLGEREVLQ